MRKRGKVDVNQRGFVSGLRACGYSVFVTSSLGGGFPDLLVGAPLTNVLFELKRDDVPDSQCRFTPQQEIFFRDWKGPKFKVKTIEEALEILKRFH